MKLFKFCTTILLLLIFALPVQSQENPVVPQRTPEQEAVKQTEKLQQELSLTQEQTRQIYEINLRYARERQISNTRSEAMERMKNKNADIQKILTPEQNERLQSKRYERTSVDAAPGGSRMPQTMPSAFRAPAEFRSGPATVRVPAGDVPHTSLRPVTPGQQSTQQSAPQTVRRVIPSSGPTSTPGTNPYTAPVVRSAAPQSSPPASTRPSAPASNGSRGSEPSSGSSRR